MDKKIVLMLNLFTHILKMCLSYVLFHFYLEVIMSIFTSGFHSKTQLTFYPQDKMLNRKQHFHLCSTLDILIGK